MRGTCLRQTLANRLHFLIAFVRYIGAGTNQPGLNADGSGYRLVSLGASSVKTVDKEKSLALDAIYNLQSDALTTLEMGVRIASTASR